MKRPRPLVPALIVLALLVVPGNVIAQNDPTGAAAEKEELNARVRTLTEALAGAPDAVRLYSQRGDARLFLGQFKEAVADFEKMIELDPQQDAPHWRLGIAYYFAGEFEKSSAQFLKYQTFESGDRENGICQFLGERTAWRRRGPG
jgi:tetratricopeptide (TPR) repeat protein